MNNYDNAEPKPLKFLVSDGKLVDESGNVIAESDSLQDIYVKSSPQVKKYLLSDGSVVDENNNLIIKNDYYKKVYDQTTPKVAKYLHLDGTIDENPGGGSNTAYAWKDNDNDVWYFDFDSAPESKLEFQETMLLEQSNDYSVKIETSDSYFTFALTGYHKESDNEFSIVVSGKTQTFTRNSSNDFTLWKRS